MFFETVADLEIYILLPGAGHSPRTVIAAAMSGFHGYDQPGQGALGVDGGRLTNVDFETSRGNIGALSPQSIPVQQYPQSHHAGFRLLKNDLTDKFESGLMGNPGGSRMRPVEVDVDFRPPVRIQHIANRVRSRCRVRDNNRFVARDGHGGRDTGKL